MSLSTKIPTTSITVEEAIYAFRKRSEKYVEENSLRPQPLRGEREYRNIVKGLTGFNDANLLGVLGEHLAFEEVAKVTGYEVGVAAPGQAGYDGLIDVDGHSIKIQVKTTCDTGKTRIELPPASNTVKYDFDVLVGVDIFPMAAQDEEPDFYIFSRQAAMEIAATAPNANTRPRVQMLHWAREDIPTLGGSNRSVHMPNVMLPIKNNWQPLLDIIAKIRSN